MTSKALETNVKMTAPRAFGALGGLIAALVLTGAGANEQERAAHLPVIETGLIDAPSLPADAALGQCLTQVYRPGAGPTSQLELEIEPEHIAPKAFPAVMRWAEREIVIRPEEIRYETTAAVFEKRVQTVVIEPARIEHRVIPAEFRTITERVEIQPAAVVWRPGPGRTTRRHPQSGVLQHRVVQAAQFTTIVRRELVRPARVETIEIPAVTRDFETEVMVRPAETRRIVVPAEIKTVRVLEVARPARVEQRRYDARTATLSQKAAPARGSVEWRRALCAGALPTDLVRDVQRALRRRGYDAGPVDGRVGPATRAALVAFQGVEPMSDRVFLLDTLERLGVQISAAPALSRAPG